MGFIKENIKGIIIGSIGLILLIMSKNSLHVIKIGQKIRNDAMGSGIFGASRSGGTRKHKGIDIIFIPGESVLSPISGTVTRFAIPYADDSRFSGIEIKNSSYKVIMFYLNPGISVGTSVAAGQQIGVSQNIAGKHGGGMINHVHLEVYDSTGKLIDPTNLF